MPKPKKIATMQTSTFIVSMGIVLLLVGCSLTDRDRRLAEPVGDVSVVTQTVPNPHPEEPTGAISANPIVAPDPHSAVPDSEGSKHPTAVPETSSVGLDGEVSTFPTVTPDPHPEEPDSKVAKDPTAVPETSSVGLDGEVSAFPTVTPEPHIEEPDGEVSATPTTAVPEAASDLPNREVSFASPLYDGPSFLESRILKSPVIARVRLDSVSSTVESGPTYQGTKYLALLEFNLTVLEYLKGSGADDIVAVWVAAPLFDTRQAAAAALPAIIADRNTARDNYEAIVFLQNSDPSIASTLQTDRYYLAWGGGTMDDDDGYSIASRYDKLWLPADAQSDSSGDQQRFLMDVPPATGTAPTITLGELRTRNAAVVAKLDAGDDSGAHRECVRRTYLNEGINQYRTSIGDDGHLPRTPDQELASGLPSSSVVFEKTALGGLPNTRAEVWLEEGDADLFSVLYGDSVPHDFSGDGVIDSIQYVRRIVSARPLPEGSYITNYNRRDARFVRCDGYSFSHDWTITVNAPEGVLHEAFFDPVTDGMAVAADDTNGVLKPVAFTDADGAAATIERIEWESGTVKLKVSPHTGLSGHVMDFIELDGTTSLSLNADQATVDAANDTLSWSVGSQPWDDGDELMVRVGRGACWNDTAVPNPSQQPRPDARLHQPSRRLKDALRGTATLNWSVDTAITSWDGVKVSGSPVRVTSLVLVSEGLTGTIPPDLARLDGLEYLWLGYNQLTGEIPAALGGLASLKSLLFNRNRLTGAVPRELGGLSRLESLWLNENQLSGEIPASLGDLGNLRQLLLAGNRLSGAIPSVLGDLSNLEHLKLNYNQLTGEIPSALGRLSNLKDLLLGVNQLTGCIPPALRNVEDNDLASLGLQDCATP